MSLSKKEQRILQFLQDNKDKSYSVSELANIFNYHGNKNYKKFIKALSFLEHINEIQFLSNGRVQASGNLQSKVIGTFQGHEKGYGFVSYSEDQADLFIPPHHTANAMSGDKVEVTIIKPVNAYTGKGSEARVERVIERSAQQIVGEFFAYDKDKQEETSYLGYVIPQGEHSQSLKVYVIEGGIEPVDHAIVIVKIKDYPTIDRPDNATGLVAKEIGHRDEPGVDILAILYQFSIPHEFPDNVVAEAEQFGQEINPEHIKGRHDLRNQCVMTIDGADAKDIDDAISLDKIGEDVYRLYVHIADVSFYVEEGSAIDHEAFDRGTSVYLTDRVVPMLPQRISNGICSLHPNVDRLTLTCQMDINREGQVIAQEIYPSVINSSYRMTYEDVNKIYDEDEALRQKYAEIVPMLEEMRELHEILVEMRTRRGAISFETTEAIFDVDEQGHPINIYVRERGVGERLIESFMLVANETVARFTMSHDYPLIYRVHEQPDADRMLTFAEFVTSFGVVLRGHVEAISPKQLQEVLDELEDTPYEEVVSKMMLRSMQQARYSEEPLGHFGLAAEEYTHFTAPIRRYPDLTVHRLIHQYIQSKPSVQQLTKIAERLPVIADHASMTERRAVEAERETDALKKAEYMADKIGEEYTGTISSITSFGIFVQLANSVEGLIAINKLQDDYYQYYPNQLVLIGENTRRVYRMGQKVRIVVDKVDIAEREIDFNLLEAEHTDNSDLVHLMPKQKKKKKKQSQSKYKGKHQHSSKSSKSKKSKRKQ